MKNNIWKSALAVLCVLALTVGILSTAAFAVENDTIYVNGDKKVFTADGELSAILRLQVEATGKIHILTSGVNVALAVYNEDNYELCGTYATENGMMDVPFDATPGTYLLGFSGWGEVAVLVADESMTAQLYGTAAVPAEETVEEPAEETTEEIPEEPAEKPAEEPTEEIPEEPAEEPAEAPTEEIPEEPVEKVAEESGKESAAEIVEMSAGEPAEPVEESPAAADLSPFALIPEEPIHYEFTNSAPVSVLSILNDAGSSVNMVREVTRETDGFFSSFGTTDGDWLLTAYAYFDSIEVSVKAGYFDPADGSITDAVYTLVLTYPDPAQVPAEEPVEEIIETPAEEVCETPAEEPAEGESNEELPAEDSVAPEESPAEFAEEPGEDSIEESLLIEDPIRYEFPGSGTYSVLSILNGVGSPVNMVQALTRDTDGWFFDTASSDGDWLLTPYAYFDSMDVSVKAAYFNPTDGSVTGADYTLVLSYPDPEKDPAAADSLALEESPDSLPLISEVTIAMERIKGKEIRLFAENLEPEETENLAFQWQSSLDNEHWEDIPDANGSEYVFTLNSTNSTFYWRLIVSEK